MANMIDTINLENLNVLFILKNVNNVLEDLDKVSHDIISSINEIYYSFCQSVGSKDVEITKTHLKKIDSYKDSTATRIKEIRQDVWDDYWEFVKTVADLMDDIPDYESFKEELGKLRQSLTGIGAVQQCEVIQKRSRKITACENRMKKYINSFNKRIASFNALNLHLSQKNICYNESVVNSSAIISEFKTLIDDYTQKTRYKNRYNPYQK